MAHDKLPLTSGAPARWAWPPRWLRLSAAMRGLLALMRMLPQVSVPLTIAAAATVLLSAALPLGTTLASGRLVGAVPAALRGGWDAVAGRTAVQALVTLGALFVMQRLMLALRTTVARSLWLKLVHYLDERLMRALNAAPGIAHLEEPAMQNRIEMARGARISGSAQGWNAGYATLALCNKAPLLLQSAGYAVLLAGFQPVLAAAYFALIAAISEVRRRQYLRETQVIWTQSGALRRANYLRDLGFTSGAAKEVRVYNLAGWLSQQYTHSWFASMLPIWRDRARGELRAMTTHLVLALAHAAVLGAIGWAGVHGTIDLAAVTVYVGAVAGIGVIGLRSRDDLALAWGTAGVLSLLELEAEAQLTDAAYASPSGHLSGSPLVARAQSVADRDMSARVERTNPLQDICFEGVAFRYPGATAATFVELDLRIPAGQSLAVVGANGAGKTTLVKLLCRLYEPQAGRITSGGRDLRDLNAKAWQRQVAAIFQDFVQYPLPARDNVSLGAIERAHDLHQIVAAARQAGALELIAQLPAGWDTILSRQFTGGADLSGGQWQRVALARALFAVNSGARILVLDEPTANLDVRAEAELYERFLEITAGLTTILISHRFSTVRQANQICVLAHGQVTELGTHAELIAARGEYASMFALQAARFTEDNGDA